MGEPVEYRDISAAIAPTGMVARGGFVTTADDALDMPDGRSVRSVVIVGNIGGAMWKRFRDEQQPGPHPLDRWTRETLAPIAATFSAAFVHPSDQPFRPFQRWAQRADDVWPSPIGMLIHSEYGLWHAYRGAFLFAEPVRGLPSVGNAVSPCDSCDGRPCLMACPVNAFTAAGYDTVACASHVGSGGDPDCLHEGCAARRACPVGAGRRYDADQMLFHMRAFVGT